MSQTAAHTKPKKHLNVSTVYNTTYAAIFAGPGARPKPNRHEESALVERQGSRPPGMVITPPLPFLPFFPALRQNYHLLSGLMNCQFMVGRKTVPCPKAASPLPQGVVFALFGAGTAICQENMQF